MRLREREEGEKREEALSVRSQTKGAPSVYGCRVCKRTMLFCVYIRKRRREEEEKTKKRKRRPFFEDRPGISSDTA